MGLTKPRAAQIYNLDYKQSTRVVTVTNVTLSGGAPSTVDGVSLSLNDRILVTGQSTGSQNGLYYVTTVGTGSTGTWARTSDGNETGEIEAGMIVMVTEGTIYADTQWKLTTNDPITVGTTALTFTQNYSANSISSGTSNVVVTSNANVTISSAGTANVLTISSTGTVISGTESVTGNITGGNILTSGLISATGNITGGNILGGANVNATTHTGTTVSVTANITGGNVLTGGLISATGNVTGGNLITSGKVYGLELNSTQSSGDEGGQINLSLAATNTTLSGNVVVDIFQNRFRIFEGGGTARGAYIDLTQAGAGASTNLLSGGGGGTPGGANTNVQFNDGGLFGGNAQFTYNKVTNLLTVGNVSANSNGLGTNYAVGDDAYIGDINTADTVGIKGQQNPANAYIVFGNSDSTGKLGRAGTGPLTYAGAFSATANITGGNILTSGVISATGNITGGNILGGANVNATTHTGTTVSVTANITGGNILTGGIISATGNVSGGNVAAATTLFSLGTVGASGNVSGGNLTTIGQVSATANITGGNVLTSGLISATGNVSGGNLIVTGNIIDTGDLILTSSAANANIRLLPTGIGTIIISGNITNSQGNGVGNIGNATGYFNTIFAKATSAQYADLAEMYSADADYPPGTVVAFDGPTEITISNQSHSTQVAGIISTNPSYLMNSAQAGEHVLAVALTGRVPCRVVGTIHKGDRLVASTISGVATVMDKNLYEPGCIIGKSLEDYDSTNVGIIEVAVGRF
jgi:hypothetical protein